MCVSVYVCVDLSISRKSTLIHTPLTNLPPSLSPSLSLSPIPPSLPPSPSPPPPPSPSLPPSLPISERTLEDHEKVLETLAHWPKGCSNNVVFKNNPEKYYLLKRPQMLMPSSHVYSSVNPTRTTFTEEQKKNIILKVR